MQLLKNYHLTTALNLELLPRDIVNGYIHAESNLCKMYWQEKIDRIGIQFAPADFNRHFTDWPEILKTLESRFLIKRDLNSHFSNWSEQFKSPNVIQAISREKVNSEIDRLENSYNYWAIFTHGDYPTAKQVVYDCKPIVIKALIEISTGDFFIGDKKYNWLVQFHQTTGNTVSLVKSGKYETPFEKRSDS
jgi:hypothetical protein